VYVTILSGDISTPGDNSDNSYHVVTGSGVSATTILDGFTITGGNANGPNTLSYGGGIYNYMGSPTVTNCTLSGNSASLDGGGMHNENESNPTITNCTFEGNNADRFGGGIYDTNSNPSVSGCTFSGNSGVDGAGMYNHSKSSPMVTSSTFSDNVASQFGGGIYNWADTAPRLMNCTLSGNSAENGAGIYNYGSNSILNNCTFNGNTANADAGGIYNYSGTPIVRNCTFSGNSANGAGGMYNFSSSPTVTSCEFVGNSADYGGGIYNWGVSSPLVTKCIIYGNSASYDGGGVFNASNSSAAFINCIFSGNSAGEDGGVMSDVGSSTTVFNCTFAHNSAANGRAVACDSTNQSNPSNLQLANCILWDGGGEVWNNDGSTITITYSDVQGGWGDTGNIDADPLFMDANGPDGIIGTVDDDLRLSGGSPCIDAGDNIAVPSGITTDFDLNPRFVDDPRTTDTGNGTAPFVDMGVYEYWAVIFVDADAFGTSNGMSWANAFNYLQNALIIAQEGDEIWVAQGTYKPDQSAETILGSRTATFQLRSGVVIKGGYAGFGEAAPSRRNIGLYKTILSGDINTIGVNSDNSYHVVTGNGTDANTVLDGFTVTAGDANAYNTYDKGGGMYNYSGSPTVLCCTFIGNFAENCGGGMYNELGSPTVINCTFTSNSAGVIGGGMFNYDYSSPLVTDCTFTGNSAGNSGGGMHNSESSNPMLTNCILWGNSAPIRPEIDNSSTNPTVAYSDVEGCGGSGGGWDPNCGTDGGGNIDDDPRFIDPNGPDGIPGTADDTNANILNVHLSNYSPCINAGDPFGDYTGRIDVDGQPRLAYDAVDMGVDEVFPMAGDFEPDGDVDFVDFALFAENWLVGVE
jgi:parallel beta-helix repeat protein